jgi:YegS/Rv2252/BmrU family lipid kinase
MQMTSRRRALILGNQRARKVAAQLDRAKERLAAAGIELAPRPIRRSQDIPRLIREHRGDVDFVILGGGDGTLNAGADALLETQLPLGVLPLGTANDMAHSVGIPADLEGACDVIVQGHSRRIDLGRVNGKHYFNVAGIGMSVEVTRQLTGDLKKRWGVLAYAITAIRALGNLRPFQAEIRSGDEVYRVRTVQIMVGNGRYYGGFMAIAEDATIDDQWLDLYSLEVDHWWQLLPLLLPLKTGRLRHRAHVRALRGRQFEVLTKKRRIINADGEIVAATPATFHVVPKAVTVFAPAASPAS